jgi:hypothetical protein
MEETSDMLRENRKDKNGCEWKKNKKNAKKGNHNFK